MKAYLAAVCFLLTITPGPASAQGVATDPKAPKPGAAAPLLVFNHLLQAPANAKVDWPSLHGKVVVLEFWATWCVPCIAEIPVLNSLQASLDPNKVQFISVDDEDPAIIEKFLQKRPISGWLGLDTSSKVFEDYGVNARPATLVVDPNGRIVTTTVHPESLQREQLLALADGRPVVFANNANPSTVPPAALAERNAILAKEFTLPATNSANSSPALFEISLTPGDKGDTHIMMRRSGQIDITNGTPQDLLRYAAGIPKTRIATVGTLPDTQYNLHVDAPHAEPGEIAHAVELALASGGTLRLEAATATVDAYVLTAGPATKDQLTQSPMPGGAGYDMKTGKLQAVNATLKELTFALEKALGTPVVDETNLVGKLTSTLSFTPKDLASANQALGKELGLTLVPGKRPIETITLSAATPNH